MEMMMMVAIVVSANLECLWF